MVELENYESDSVCVPNIGANERRKRMVSGIIPLIIGILGGIFLIVNGWAWWTRFILFVPFFWGFTGFFQAREKT